MRQETGGSFQGVYVGAGPYLSMRIDSGIDDRLTQMLGADERVYFPNAQLTTRNATLGQAALAITGGYRGRFAWPSGVGLGTEREGLYVAANYHYLHGFRYEDVDFQLRMDADRDGLLTLDPFLSPPLLITRTNASSGTGMAVDAGVGAVVNHWELGFGVNGIGNRIDWTDVERTMYFHANLLTGSGDLIKTPPLPIGDVRVELPVDYRANVGYDVDRWAAVAEFGQGFQGKSFHGGVEYRLDAIELRGGAVYSRELWSPATGVGFNMSRRTALDVAVYGNSANVARERRPAVAGSLRFNR